MPIDAELVKLHRGAINVWVEDVLSSEYLNELWREPRALFLIAGATDSVKPVVTHAARSGLNNVFGIVDRDFEETNQPRWQNPTLRHFVLPAHEMENYLLDANALAACDVNNQGRTPTEVETRMQDRAQTLLVWMTTCHVIKHIRRTCLDDFMARPSAIQLQAVADIWPYIHASPWYRDFAANAANINTVATVQAWIGAAHASLVQDLGNGNWKRTFSGKEIFRDVRGYIYQPNRVAPSMTYDLDLAQSIARWQADSKSIPGDLGNLLDHIRQKVEL